MYRIQASDNSFHLISKEAAVLSEYFTTCCDLLNGDEPILLGIDATGEQIRLMIDFMEMAKDKQTVAIRRPLIAQGDLVASGMPEWAKAWVDKIFENREASQAWDLIFALIKIGDFINYDALIKVLIAKVASRICAMDEQTKKRIFAPSRHLTEEEKERIHQENKWAEMEPPGED